MKLIKQWKRSSKYSICILICNLLAFLIIYQFELRYLNSSLQAHVKDTSEQTDEVMRNYIHSFQLFTQILQDEVKAHPEPDDIWDDLKSLDARMSAIEGDTYDGLYMYYQERYLYSWDTPYEEYESTGYDATQRPWYKDAQAGKGKIVWTPPYMSYANHYILTTISQLQPDGETVFAYDIKMGDIQKLVTELNVFDQEQMLIMDTHGTIIGSSDASYLGSDLSASLQTIDQKVEEAEMAVHDPKATAAQKEKLEEQLQDTIAFQTFRKDFDAGYQHLTQNEQKIQRFQLDGTSYYGYLMHGEEYSFLILVPTLAMLWNSTQVWLIPLLLLELLLIYILSYINREVKNKELKAAYVELGQTQKRLKIALTAAQKAAAIDELTGMMNRKSFCKAVELNLQEMKEGESGILIMIDGDHFKYVNDEYGHLIGDEVIKLSAQMIVSRIRIVDLASRLHGDEFAIFVSNTDDYTVAAHIMKDINTAIAKEGKKRNLPSITLSSGAVVAHHDAQYTKLAEQADMALYQAKERHDGSFCSADGSLSDDNVAYKKE